MLTGAVIRTSLPDADAGAGTGSALSWLTG